MRLSGSWSWGGEFVEFDFSVRHLQSRGSVRYVTILLVVCILWCTPSKYEQGSKGTHVLYYISISRLVLIQRLCTIVK